MCAADASQQEFNPDAFIDSLCQNYELRFREADVPDDNIESMVRFLGRMAHVSVQLTQQEKEIKIPNTNHVVPFDGPTSARTVELFCEGMGEALIRTSQLGIPDEPREQILQNVAQYVYENAKQVVLSTFGQDSTPDIQIPEEQQFELLYQTANSALTHFITQYEEEHQVSLIEKEGMPDDIGDLTHSVDDIDPMMAPQQLDQQAPQPPVQQSSQQAPQPPQPQPPASQQQQQPQFPPVVHEKLAAVALLLNTLPQDKGQQMYNMFNPEQQQLIQHYLNPVHIQQALNLNAVLHQLHALRQRILGDDPSARSAPPLASGSPQVTNEAEAPSVSAAYHAMKQLAEEYPKQALLKLVEAERPRIQQYVAQLFEEDLPVEAILSSASSRQNDVALPSHIETLLYQHLHQALVGEDDWMTDDLDEVVS